MSKDFELPYLVSLRSLIDSRGELIIGEFADLPFKPQRFFIQKVNHGGTSRGGHAHRSCEQLLIPLVGDVEIEFFSGDISNKLILSDPAFGLYIPKMVWANQFFERRDASLLVLASEPYQENDYIRSFGEFELAMNGSLNSIKA